jgi:preprotein translocase subunit SecF
MASLRGLGGRLYRGEVSVEFVRRQKLWYSISGVILVVSVAAVLVFGLNFSVDFKGGAVFSFPAHSGQTVLQVQKTVSAAGGGSDSIVQHVAPVGKAPLWQVQTHRLTTGERDNVQAAIARTFGVSESQINTSFVDASWGSQISHKAVEALIAFLIVIVIYLSIAFEWKMALSALIALAHDIVITVGVYALAHFQVSPATVIGLLTILGYSLYDTVVVFDKVRENTAGLAGTSRSTYSQAANQALNQTLVRSINTSVTALLPVAGILIVSSTFLPPGELRDLSLVLFVGMLSGTYSSICIATPVLADLKEREPQYRALAKRVALRASGGRAAKRAAAKAGAKGASADNGIAGTAGGPPAGVAVLDGDEDVAAGPAEDVAEGGGAEDTGEAGPPAAGDPVPAAAAQPAARRPGPAAGRARQQPRRSAAKRRPSGKKRRR